MEKKPIIQIILLHIVLNDVRKKKIEIHMNLNSSNNFYLSSLQFTKL